MKRIIICLLAITLLIPSTLTCVFADDDSILIYDDSKPIVPNVILFTMKIAPEEFEWAEVDSWWCSEDLLDEILPLIYAIIFQRDLSFWNDDETWYYATYKITLNKMCQHDEIIGYGKYVAESLANPELNPYDISTLESVTLIEKPIRVDDYEDIVRRHVEDWIYYDRIVVDIDFDYVSKNYEWSVEDFPELDLKEVEHTFKERLTLFLNESGEEAIIDAVQKLSTRYEFTYVGYDWRGPDMWVPDPTTQPESATDSEKTTEPQTDPETDAVTETAPQTEASGTIALTPDETTGAADSNPPSAPQTGDELICIAVVGVLSLICIAGVLIYRRKFVL